jgi:S-layer protein (TIGR01567 family)
MLRKKTIMLAALAALLTTSAALGAAEKVEVRGAVADLGAPEFTWNPNTFPGFYYDLDKSIGTEQITFLLSDANGASATLSDQMDPNGNRGISYKTVAQKKSFKFGAWGSYYLIGFLGEPYFAAYEGKGGGEAPFLYEISESKSLLASEQLSRVLIDNDTEMAVSVGVPLKLEEGYELNLTSLDVKSKKVSLELMKDGQRVDAKVIQPSIDGAKLSDKTYYYVKDLGGNSRFVTLAVHFKNTYSDEERSVATVNGIFQISDKPVSVKAGQKYGMISVKSVDSVAISIAMDNKGNSVLLSKDKDVPLMPGLSIRTADQDATADNPLRYYICRELTGPGIHQIRGTVANLGMAMFTWDPRNFAGLYYDIDKNIGTEQITLSLTGVNAAGSSAVLSDQLDAMGMRGVVYKTTAQQKNFRFKPWGSCNVIAFLGERYFAAYNPVATFAMEAAGVSIPFLYDKSKNRNLMTSELLSRVLMDDNAEQMVKKGTSLRLAEGYELFVRGVNQDGQVFLELMRNGSRVEEKVISPSAVGATMADKTYYYKKDLGNAKEVVVIAVHFKNAYRDEELAAATADGIWQISDAPLSIRTDQEYGKLSIRSVDPTAMVITMDNKDNQIALGRNMDVPLMGKIHIRTADQSNISAEAPLRYCIYTPVTIEAAAEA